MTKQPKAAYAPQARKAVPHGAAPGVTVRRQPRLAADAEDSAKKHPIWRFHVVDYEGPFGWGGAGAKLRQIVSKMVGFESMTWSQIDQAGSHFLTPAKLSKEARDRLQKIKQDDGADQVYSFRLSGVERVIGIRTGREFWFLWWDPEHAVCPSMKKNT